ncbi:MAG: putative peptidyl-prolyl cis-trans isomerase [Candidatus Anoxychlamydiales bacterium]|nr:putative peptidyl-prolyl cis-trans isomerase [Candidatus Anoxychlamydiales bacterium]
MKKLLLVLTILSSFIFAKTFSDDIVSLETSQGVITIKLWPEVAPKACENFLKLVENSYYDGIVFHRVIKNFMIQTGDPSGTGAGGQSIWNKPFEDEVKSNIAFNRKGLVAMANAGPNTNGSQFFITTKMTPWLNMKHTIFGEVIEGYDTVQKIENIKTIGYNNKPEIEQKIVKAYINTEAVNQEK